MSDFNEEVSHFKLEWSQLLYPSDDMNEEDLNDTLMQIDMPEPHENLVLDSEHSIVSLPMSSSQTEVILPVTTQSLFHAQTDTTIFPSISNFQDETPCPPSDENEVPPEFDESLIDMSVHDIQQFIDGQQNKNTMKKTLRDVSLVEKLFRLKKEERDIHLIPPNELDPLLANFLLTVRKKDGGDFEPCTLRSIISSIDRKLRRTKYGHSIIATGMKDVSFNLTREALKAKQKQLKQQGKGNKPKRACPLTDEEINILYNRNVLGSHTPQSLLNTLWLNNSVQFGLRGVHEHYNLRWGDVTLNTASDGAKYLQLNERQTKTRTGENLSDVREVTPKIYEAEDESPERDPIKIYEIYSMKRPNNFSNADDPFYIAPRTIPLEDPKTNIWFLRQKVGERKLADLMKKMKENGKIDINKRLTNHSARKYLLQKLREHNVEGTDIMQISGHKNIASINNYSKISEEKHKQISKILSNTETNSNSNINALVPVTVVSNLPRTTSTCTNSTASSTSDISCRSNPNASSYCANSNTNNMSREISSMFYGAVLHVNTLNVNLYTNPHN